MFLKIHFLKEFLNYNYLFSFLTNENIIEMRTIKLFAALLVGSAIFSGCALNKMVKLAKEQDLKVDPNPLEVHGGKVAFNMSAVLPPKMLPKGKVYTLNTIYQYGDQEMNLPAVEFKAEEFASSSTTTSRKSQDFEFDYKEGMNPGTLYVQGEAKDPRKNKSKLTEKLPVAEGLITTSTLVKDVYYSPYADHGYNNKEELVPTNVAFYFDQGRSALKYSEKKSDRGQNFNAFVAEKNVTRTVTITGLHSPEGSERVNSNLAEDRAKAIETYYRQQMKNYDYQDLSDDIKFILKPVVEDWSAFKDALQSYNGISDEQKSEVLRIVNGLGSFEEKEDNLQKLSSYKKLLKDVYPPLRTAKTEILTVKAKKSNAQISVLAKMITESKVNGDTLSMEEMLYSGTLTPSLDEKVAIYKAATKKGTSWVAHNNLAATYLKQAANGETSKINEAVTQLEIAAKLQPSAEVHSNLATAYVMQGNYAKALENALAAEQKSSSSEIRSGINGVKGSILIRNAEYSKAVTALASASDSDGSVNYDKGLAYLLNKEYQKAKAAFGDVPSSSKSYAWAQYGAAIAAARNGNADEIAIALKNAVSADASLKAKALSDLEFKNYKSAVEGAVK